MYKKSSSNKKTLRSFVIKLTAVVLMSISVISLASTVIYAQATNPWNIQRNTTTNDLDFYLNSNGLSGSSLQLKSNGSARIRSLYDLEDNSNTYKIDPNATSVLNTLNVTTLSASTINTPNLTNFSLTTNGAVIYLPEISGNSSYTGIAASNGFMSDGLPWYGGFGREPGGWTSPFPDYVISNHTGLRLAAHGGYGGVSIYDQYSWANGTWTSSGTEVARFRADQAGGSYLTGSLKLGTTLNASGYNPINFNYNNYSTPNGTFRLTPNVHINTPANYGVIINWDNGSTADASVGQFVVGNGAGGSLFTVARNAIISGNYFHTWPNDSWFPYINNWNYFRGYTMAFTQAWYDENDTSTYIDPSAFSKFNQLGFNTITCIGSYCPQYGLLRVTPNIHLNTPSNTGFYVNWDNGVTTAPNSVYPFNVGNGNGGHLFYVRGDGYVWTIGQFAAANVWYSSDERLKKDINTINSPLSKLLNLRGVTYKYDKQRYPEKTSMLTDDKQLGFIAQEVEKVLPEVVTSDNDGFKSVSYGNISALIVEGIKEQENHINSLQQEFAEFKVAANGDLESVKQELETQKQINDKQDKEIQELRDEIRLLKQQIQQ